MSACDVALCMCCVWCSDDTYLVWLGSSSGRQIGAPIVDFLSKFEVCNRVCCCLLLLLVVCVCLHMHVCRCVGVCALLFDLISTEDIIYLPAFASCSLLGWFPLLLCWVCVYFLSLSSTLILHP